MLTYNCCYSHQMVKKTSQRSEPYPTNPARQSLRHGLEVSRMEAEADDNPSFIPQVDQVPQVPSTSAEATPQILPIVTEQPAVSNTGPIRVRSAPKVPSMVQFKRLQKNVTNITSVLSKLQQSIDNLSNKTSSSTPVSHVNSNVNSQLPRVDTPVPTQVEAVDLQGQVPLFDNTQVVIDADSDSEPVPAQIHVNQLMSQVVDGHIQSLIDVDTPPDTGNYKQLGRPLDLKVPDIVKQKIWAKQYVDFDKLLDQPTPKTTSSLELYGNKLVTVKQSKQISSIGQWCDAFNIFHTCYSRKYPHETPQLLSYLNTIKSLSQRNGDYLTYDREFRYMKASNDM